MMEDPQAEILQIAAARSLRGLDGAQLALPARFGANDSIEGRAALNGSCKGYSTTFSIT